MIRLKKKLYGLAALLLAVSAIPVSCSPGIELPKDKGEIQPQKWTIIIKADKGDNGLTRSVFSNDDGATLKAKWNDNQAVEVYDEEDNLVGTLHAAGGENGETVITGSISGSYSDDPINPSTLKLYSPSRARNYNGQVGTIESMSEKDYISSTITVTAVDGNNGVLTTTNAHFDHLQSFNKITFSESVSSITISAAGLIASSNANDEITTGTLTVDATPATTEFYVAMANSSTDSQYYTFTSGAKAAFVSVKISAGKYYTPATLTWNELMAIDLGLPSGLKWANMNVGSTSETDYGVYYAWGETEGYNNSSKTRFYWDTYRWGSGENALTKYCNNTSYGNEGFTDGLMTLELADDAAYANLGGLWRMPTASEYQELLDNTTQTWVANYMGSSCNGYLFTSKNIAGRSIFLPAAGWRNESAFSNQSSNARYWLSSLNNTPSSAKDIRYNTVGGAYAPQAGVSMRYSGFPIRAVYGEPETGMALSKITNSHLGYYVCSDGSCYSPSTSVPSGKTVAGMIAYVSGAGHGLIIAKSDAYGSNVGIANMNSYCGIYTPTISYGNTTLTWVLPSKSQWQNMIDQNVDSRLASLSSAGVSALVASAYWTSTPHGNGYNDAYYFSHHQWRNDFSSAMTGYLRSCAEF